MKTTEPKELYLFRDKKLPDIHSGWHLYEKAIQYNDQINLNETVRVNENFYIGKQWEGVKSEGLPTPVFNFIKRVVGFTVANITSDNIKVTASQMANVVGQEGYKNVIDAVNNEFQALTERNRIPKLTRELTRNAAVDGDGCTYTYWDADMETGQASKGGIKTEIIQNNRVFFGNPNDNNPQKQPWIMIHTSMLVRDARLRASNNGISNYMDIVADEEDANLTDSAKLTYDKVTDLLLLWRAESDIDFGDGKSAKKGEICAYEFTKTCEVKKPWSLGIKLYPITWLNWDYIQDCYHGQSMVTGIIPNQIYVNKQWAMYMISNMRGAYGQRIFDKTRIKSLDNRVGGAIPVNGNVQGAVDIIDPVPISPQVVQSFQMAVEQTEQCLGATSVALGDTRPDNTSAIIALQRAASTPHELTKQNVYDQTEELYRIYLEFMGEYYGKRYIEVPTPQRVAEASQFAGLEVPDTIPQEFDFKVIKEHPVNIKLDVGASTYYSQIAAINTLDNLLRNGNIDTIQYLERIPDDYIPGRQALISDIKRQRQMMMQQQNAMMGAPMQGAVSDQQIKQDVHGGGGYSALQRKINETGDTKSVL